MDISNKIENKLEFSSKKYLQLSKLLSVIDTFKGAWNEMENKESRYLNEVHGTVNNFVFRKNC